MSIYFYASCMLNDNVPPQFYNKSDLQTCKVIFVVLIFVVFIVRIIVVCIMCGSAELYPM
jgi:hypothetical protein